MPICIVPGKPSQAAGASQMNVLLCLTVAILYPVYKILFLSRPTWRPETVFKGKEQVPEKAAAVKFFSGPGRLDKLATR
jgi:hypothetical protein